MPAPRQVGVSSTTSVRPKATARRPMAGSTIGVARSTAWLPDGSPHDESRELDAPGAEVLAGPSVASGIYRVPMPRPADQAHLLNDFRGAVGITPGAYLRSLRALAAG